MKTDDELEKWFRERLVWNDPSVVVDLLKSGLFIRAYEPQVSHTEALGLPLAAAHCRQWIDLTFEPDLQVIMRGFPEEEEEEASGKAGYEPLHRQALTGAAVEKSAI